MLLDQKLNLIQVMKIQSCQSWVNILVIYQKIFFYFLDTTGQNDPFEKIYLILDTRHLPQFALLTALFVISQVTKFAFHAQLSKKFS